MKRSTLTLLALGLPAFGFSADLSPTAKAAAVAASPTAKPAAPVATPAPQPTAKPLYVDYTPPDWAKGWDHITLAQAKKWQKDPKILFLDARAKVEYDGSHIPGALPLPTGEADKYYTMYESEIKHAKKLVTYCHGIGCRLSEKSAKFLVDKGYKNVAVFFGGWPQWSEAKLPVESGESKAPKSTPVPTAAPASSAGLSPSASASSLSSPAAVSLSPTALPAPAAMSPAAKAESKPVSPAAK